MEHDGEAAWDGGARGGANRRQWRAGRGGRRRPDSRSPVAFGDGWEVEEKRSSAGRPIDTAERPFAVVGHASAVVVATAPHGPETERGRTNERGRGDIFHVHGGEQA